MGGGKKGGFVNLVEILGGYDLDDLGGLGVFRWTR